MMRERKQHLGKNETSSLIRRARSRRPLRRGRLSMRGGCESLESRQLLAADLVGHWLADRLTGANGAVLTEWNDVVSTIPASAVGQPTLETNAVGGRSMVHFVAADGNDAFRVRGAVNPIANQGDFTVAVAMRTDSTALRGEQGPWFDNTGLVDSSARGFSQDWGVSLNAAGQVAAGLGGGFGQPSATLYSTAQGLNDGQLHIIVVTRQGSTMSIQVDDRVVDTRANFSAAARSPVDMTFGMLQSNDGPFTGSIGQIRLYRGAMTAAESAQLRTDLTTYYRNTAPVTNDDHYTLDEDVAFFSATASQGVLVNDIDADRDALQAVLVSPAQNGKVVINADGSFIYTPNRNFFGTDSFTYTANDFRAGNVGTVTLDVRSVYDPPAGVADQYKATPTQAIHVAAANGVLTNDTNVDNAPMSVVLDQNVSFGQLTLQADGSFDFDAQGTSGNATFTYRINDGRANSSPATVTIVVNAPPEARDDSYSVTEEQVLTVAIDASVLKNDLDRENQPLTAAIGAAPKNGTVQLQANGSFVYTPKANFSGTDSFTYTVNDGIDTGLPATVRIQVNNVNDAPIAVGDVYVVDTGSLQTSPGEGVLANDKDIDGPTLKATLVEGTQFGALTLRADGSFDYTPRDGYTGIDRFTYKADDGVESTGVTEVLLVAGGAENGTSDPTGDSVVTFNEVMYNPAGDDEIAGEWIELRNQMAINMDISRWRLAGGLSFDFAEGTVIPGNGYLLIAANPELLKSQTGQTNIVGPWIGRLDNGGETIELRNNSDRVMDVLRYDDAGDWPVGADGSGATLAKRSVHLATGEPQSWTHSVQLSGTPGADNFAEYDPTPINVALIPWNSTYRYLDQAAAPNGAWREAVYDDSQWSQGTTVFEAGDANFPPTDTGGLAEPGAGLLGYWPLNATSGTVADNLVDGATDGNLLQGATWTADTQRGFVLSTDGRNDYVDAGTIPAIGLNDNFTWAFWFKLDTTTNANAVILGNRAGGPSAPLQFAKFTPSNFEYYSDAGDPMLANALPTGKWQHLAVVKSGPNLVYYVDGQPVAQGVTTHGQPSMPFYFGGDPNAAGEFAKGLFDDVAIWNRALPADAVAGLSRGTYSPTTAPTVFRSGPIVPADLPSTRTDLSAGTTTYYFRRSFEFNGDPTGAALQLSGLIGDGAAYYLNGQEIYRHNLPAGDLTSTTRANSENDAIGAVGPITVPTSALVRGTNVLAIEVHQSSTAGDALFATQLTARVVPEDTSRTLLPTIHEVTAADAPTFAVELKNPHSTPLDVSGYRILAADQSNRAYRLGNVTIPAGGYLVLDQTQLGFRPSNNEALFVLTSDGQRVVEGVVVTDRLQGRRADLDDRWGYPTAATLGAANTFQVENQLVINELMFHAPGFYLESVDKLVDSGEEWIELYNRSTSTTIDLSNWTIDGGVSYTFPAGTKLAPDSYLVIAKDPGALRHSRPTLTATVLGPFSGSLSNRGDLVQIVDAAGNLVDEVRYHDEGRWPTASDAQGSSLELRDPLSDNRIAESWGASNESSQGEWQTITLRGTGVGASSDPTQYNELVMGLLDDGVILLDDLRVVENPDTPNARDILQNGTFEQDALGASPAKWRIIGTQHGAVVADPANASNHVLQLTATGPTEHMHNNATTTMKAGDSYVTLRNQNTYEITFKARWVSGSNQLNTRLYFNRLGTTLRLERPQFVGTPGRANSIRVANLGPTYTNLLHSPPVPEPTQPVTVQVRANDAQGVRSMKVWYAVNEGAFTSVDMARSDDGFYRGIIPPQAENAIVQFYIEGADSQGASSFFPAAGPESRALYRVQAPAAPSADPRHTFRILMTASDTANLHLRTNVMSNDRIGGTVIYRENEIFYDIGVRLKGSQRGRNTAVRVGYNVSFDAEQLFRGVHGTVGVDRSGSGDEYSQEEIIVRQIVNHAGDLPQLYDDLIHVIAPDSRFTGSAMLSMARYNDVFLDSQYENGSAGTAYEYELIYFPTTTTGGPEGLKIPNPDDVRGVSMSDQGNDKESYRWHWLIKNNRRQDDYSRIMDLLKAIGGRASDPEFFPRIEEVMDVDQWLRSFAVQILTGIGDNYASNAQHNGIFYVRPSDNKVLYLPHDLDFSFTQSVTDPIIAQNELRKLIAKPAYEHAYYGHVMDIVNTTFNANYMNSWIDHFDLLVPGQPFFQSFKTFINRRADFARTRVLTAIPQIDFAITTVGPLDVGNEPAVTLTGNGWVNVREIRLAGSDQPLPIQWVTKSQWQVTVPVQPGSHDVVLEAYDYQNQFVAKSTIQVTSTASSNVRDHLRISEVHYNPAAASGNEPAVDNDLFEFVELTNTGETPIDLKGVRLAQTEREGNTEGVRFTFGAQTLAPHAMIVVARDRAAFQARYGNQIVLASGEGDDGVADVFSGQLDNGGETLTLVDATGAVVQQFLYDDSWYPNTDGGGDSLDLLDPTSPDLASWNRALSWSPSSRRGGTPGRAADSPGDTNFDGTFNTNDLLLAFQAGEYEDNVARNSTWVEGDWNGDGDFNSQDLVYVFIIGRFVQDDPPARRAAATMAIRATPSDVGFALESRTADESSADASPLHDDVALPIAITNRVTPQGIDACFAVDHDTETTWDGDDTIRELADPAATLLDEGFVDVGDLL